MAEEGQKPEEENTEEVTEQSEDAAREAGEQPEAQSAAEENTDSEPAGESEGEQEVTLESLQAELEAAKDAALRSAAEAQNARRRADQEVEKARKFALERFSGELLGVVDNLERALDAASAESADVKAISEGVDLTLKGLLEVFKKFNIEAVDPTGEPFDPNLHQAMTMVPNPDMEPNTVMDVMQKGYTLSGRLIRPAMVVVSKAPD